MMGQTGEPLEVLVVGGGQAGLAMGYHLQRAGVRFLILEGSPSVGSSWRRRWDSLRLFTPARYSGLPGLGFPAQAEHLPGKDEVADYLEAYAAHFALPVRCGEPVARLVRTEGGFRATTTAGAVYEARQVVVATGPFQTPWIPPVSAELSPEVVQLHSARYRRPADLPGDGEVLVVGGGNSGVQIAEELLATRPVTLSVGARMRRLPERLLGRSIFWWLELLGLLDVPRTSALGRRMSRTETLIGTSPGMLARRGARVVGRIASASADTLRTEDGVALRPAAVVWATGYRTDHRWMDPALLGADGGVRQTRGVTSVPGLYFLGLPWMHTRGSALIGWVERDAQHLVGTIRQHASLGPAPLTRLAS